MEKKTTEKKTQQVDRRVRRSLKMMKQGMLDLLEKKDFNSISVKDLTEETDLNRGTFYLHFESTSDVLKSIAEDLIAELRELMELHKVECVDAKSISPILEPLLVFITDNVKTCRVLFHNDSASGISDMFRALCKECGLYMLNLKYPGRDKKTYLYASAFIASGLSGLLVCWLLNGKDIPQKTFLDMANDLIKSSELSIFG